MDESASLNLSGKLRPDTVILGRYKIESQLATGGQGSVYLAQDTNMFRRVALKIINCEPGSKTEQRFQQEAKILAGLNHIVQVYAFGNIDESRLCLVMEYIDGVSLAEKIKSKGALTPAEVCVLFEQILDALGYLHSQHILHRDIKPGNILVSNTDSNVQARLLDFGIAKIVSEGPEANGQTKTLLVGTPNYMSPEQCTREALDERSDLYSLACVLYESLTAKAPFDGEAPFAVLKKQATEDFVIPPGVPDSLAKVIRTASRKNPAERYSNAAEMKNAILDCKGNIAIRDIQASRIKYLKKPAVALILGVPFAFGISLLGVNYFSQKNFQEKSEHINVPAINRANFSLRKNKEQITEAETVLKKDKREGCYQRLRALQQLAEAYKQKGNIARALKYNAQLLKEAGEDYRDRRFLAGAHYTHAVLLKERGEWSAAIEEANKAWEIAPKSQEGISDREMLSIISIERASCYCDADDSNAALPIAQAAINESKACNDRHVLESAAVNVYIRALLLSKKYPEALEKSKELIKLSKAKESEHALAKRLEQFAMQCLRAGEFEHTQIYLAMASRQLKPDDFETRVELAEISGERELQMNHKNQALKIWQDLRADVLRLSDKNPKFAGHTDWILANDFRDAGNLELSKELAIAACTLIPPNSAEKGQSYLLASYCCLKLGEVNDAVRYACEAEKALKMRPQDLSLQSFVQDTKAAAYTQAGDKEMARKCRLEAKRLENLSKRNQ